MAAAAQAGLLRQQEELDRKAAELERKERELQNTVAGLHGKGGCWSLSLPCYRNVLSPAQSALPALIMSHLPGVAAELQGILDLLRRAPDLGESNKLEV